MNRFREHSMQLLTYQNLYLAKEISTKMFTPLKILLGVKLRKNLPKKSEKKVVLDTDTISAIYN